MRWDILILALASVPVMYVVGAELRAIWRGR